MALTHSAVAELCDELQACIEQSSSSSVDLEASQLSTRIYSISSQLAMAARQPAAWHCHRKKILDAVVAGLAKPCCFAIIVERLRYYVFPAVLLLLQKICSEWEWDPETFERSAYALSQLIYDPCLTEPILECLRSVPPVFHFVTGLPDTSAASSCRCRLVCETMLRLMPYVACLRTAWDWQKFHRLLYHTDEQVRQIAGVAFAHLIGLGVVAPHASQVGLSHLSFRLTSPIVLSGLWSTGDSGAYASAELPLAGRPAAEGGASSTFSWEEGGIRARHGVCFEAIDGSVRERIPFVSTGPAIDGMHSLLLAIATGRPVLVTGASGVGKTAFLRHTAELMGQQEPVFLFCDDQTDIKMLLGTYVCGKTVGEFVWQPGVITQSLTQGRWIVLEDVDRVPTEVLAALLPLADSRQLLLPDHNRRIEAHPSFQLFGTLSSGSVPLLLGRADNEPQEAMATFDCQAGPMDVDAPVATDAPHVAEDLGLHLANARVRTPALVAAWTVVRLNALSESHMAQIIKSLYPKLAPLNGRLLASAATLRGKAEALGGPLPTGSVVVGPRELLRWCEHLRHCCLVLEPTFTEEQRTLVLREALAVFLGRVPDVRQRAALLVSLAPVWGLARGIAEALLEEQPGITLCEGEAVIGTVTLPRQAAAKAAGPGSLVAPFAYTSVHARVLQALAASVRSDEPVLLVGDTGTGKTSVVQHIGELLGKEVFVYNFNEQSESTELIGGFRPLDVVMHRMSELLAAFSEAFEHTFSRRKNAKLLERARGDFVERRWASLLRVLGGVIEKAVQSLNNPIAQSSKGCKATHVAVEWEKVQQLHHGCTALLLHSAVPRFEFVEGLLIRAMRSGAWVVLDEINLAPSDILQRIQGLIECSPGMQLALPESGDGYIIPHANFRIFACMNPPRLPVPAGFLAGASADVGAQAEEKGAEKPGLRVGQSAGKKELPSGIRTRFVEIFVDEVHSSDDVAKVVRSYLEHVFPAPPVSAIVGFYSQAMNSCRQCVLLDGAGNVSYFSLRNLTRALRFALRLVQRQRHGANGTEALAQGLAVGFATTLDTTSRVVVEKAIEAALGVAPVARRAVKAAATSAAQMAADVQLDADGAWLSVEGYWIRAGPRPLDVAAAHKDFVITPSVRQHLQNIARMLSGGRSPLLLEGPTSSGKTSLVRFLALLTGHEFVRINNHEHTDLQEYVGQYVCDPMTGQLVFQEGVLVRAARAGHWVVLDELNLAPSEVLEALNRLLDDNRELFIPDTGVVVKPHEEFMIFATQNPAGGMYGGRKQLSRAFRNRFSEIYITELPMEELAVVLHQRCQLPASFVKEMLGVYKDLQSHRSRSAVFLGRQSFMTVRDLLRWGLRRPASHQELAVEGFMLLAERLRKEEDREVVRQALEKHCSGVKELRIDYMEDSVVKDVQLRIAGRIQAGELPPSSVGSVVWTPPFCRMVALIGRCIRADEPVLLIGETGGGKTMACQVLAWALVENGKEERQLNTLNCHQQTETADFVGSLRPVRGRDATAAAAQAAAAELLVQLRPAAQAWDSSGREDVGMLCRELELVGSGEGNFKSLAQMLRKALTSASKPMAVPAAVAVGSGTAVEEVPAEPSAKRQRTDGGAGLAWKPVLEAAMQRLLALCVSWEQIFEWADGALVKAMRVGGAFLIDEISLAEDSVLERLNSVLEPEHALLLAEKPLTGTDLEVVRARPTFRLFATMNPGGDFGKRELSPALRNRFTEIWVDSIDFTTPEAESLVANQLSWPLLAKPMIRAVLWFNQRVLHPLTIREVLGWSAFIQKTAPEGARDPQLAVEMYMHGGCMVLVDCLGLGNQMVSKDALVEPCEGEVAGFLSPSQAAVMRYLVSQLEDPDLCEVLSLEARTALRTAFGDGGFAWVRQHLVKQVPSEAAHGLEFGNFLVLPQAMASAAIAAVPENPRQEFDFAAPSTACNVGRLVRALQLPKAVLLEGPPGLGKTASVQALARATGRQLLRINLSEQTDLLDLLGADLPVAGTEVASFKWQDGALLRAMRSGDWVLLDEINLAQQATLEGLNALLDHRREVFLPAISQTVVADPGFRLFAAQNPATTGGGRKGLPRSFLNRFTRVVLAELTLADLHHICQHCHGATVSCANIEQAVNLVELLRKASSGDTAEGVPGRGEAFEGHLDWDWNLRDALRLCHLLETGVPIARHFFATAELLFVSRLRRERDRVVARKLIRRISPAPEALPEQVPRAPMQRANARLREALPTHVLGRKHTGPALEGDDSVELPGLEAERPSIPELCLGSHCVKLTPRGVQIGSAVLPRKLSVEDSRCWPAFEHFCQARHLTLLSGQAKVLHTVAHAASEQLRLPVLLIGGPATGKRSIVHWLAAAAMAPLREVPLTPAMDASELLGYFEQVDTQDELVSFTCLARNVSEAMLRQLVLHAGQFTCLQEPLNQRLAQCIKACADLDAPLSTTALDAAAMLNSSEKLVAELQLCMGAVLQATGDESSGLATMMQDLTHRVARLRTCTSTAGRFEWMDGPLVTALQEGSWVLLSHVEQAAPAVLDRLNSLLEPEGFLLLTESGEERLVRPHPDFRVFFTMTLGSSKYTISRALRNRCIEVFVNAAGHAQDWAAPPPAKVETVMAATGVAPLRAGFSPNCLDFLPRALAEVAGLLEKRVAGRLHMRSAGALGWAQRALASAEPGGQAVALDSWLPTLLVDTARNVAAQAPLQATLVMHIAVLHVLSNMVWVHLRGALMCHGPEKLDALLHDHDSQEIFGRHLMSCPGFTWHTLRKFNQLFVTSTTRCLQAVGEPPSEGSRLDPHRSPLLWSFLQTYMAEVSGGKVESELFAAIFEACFVLPSMPSFCWLAEAAHPRPRTMQLGPSMEAEVARQLSPLIASEMAGQEARVALRLFLERASPTDAELRLQLLAELGETGRAWSASASAYLRHPLIAHTLPRASEGLAALMGLLALQRRDDFSVRDTWALTDCALSEETQLCGPRALHLQELLRCAHALALHTQHPSAACNPQTAWALSQRFQEGMVPFSALPHPVLSVAHPLLCSCSVGLVQALTSVTAEPSSLDALTCIRLGLQLGQRLQELLKSVAIADAKTNALWTAQEAKVLCLFQQLYAVLSGLERAPWLDSIFEHFTQLQTHLASSGLAWDPDAKRLHKTLLPLTDAMNAWGGLVPPLRVEPEFLLEQLILSALGNKAPCERHGPVCCSELLAASLIRRQQEQQGLARAEEALTQLIAIGFDAEAGVTTHGAAPQELQTARAHHTYLVLETVQILWGLVDDAEAESASFDKTVAQIVRQSCMQLARFETTRCSSEGGAACSALVQAVAELRVLQWATGGEPPWSAEEGLGLPTRERPAPPAVIPQDLVDRSLLAVRTHLLHALGVVFSEEAGKAPAGLPFMLSPSSLMRLRPPWQPEAVGPVAASLIMASGFRCAWSLSLCSLVATSTNMANHGWHRALLEDSLRSCLDAQACHSGAEDWIVLCRFLGSQFYGLQLLNAETGSWQPGTGADISGFVVALGRQLAKGGATPPEFCRTLKSLRAFILEAAARLAGSNSPWQNCPWPMQLPALVKHFLVPALDLLHGHCTATEAAQMEGDAATRGSLWVLAGLWRLHSGGGTAIPGGLDACEMAVQVHGELRHREEGLARELKARVQEEVVVDGHWVPSTGCAADLARERECCALDAMDLEHLCRLRPPLTKAELSPSLTKIPAVAIVLPTTSGRAPPSHREFCQEMVAFSTTVAAPERILRLLPAFRESGTSDPASEPMSVAELQNLTASALSFVLRLRARFPLHADLVSPVVLAVHALLYGLHMVHRGNWTGPAASAEGQGLGSLTSVPQAPALTPEVPVVLLGQSDGELRPDVVCWWLQWVTLSRMQHPRTLTAPPPVAVLQMLQGLSQRFLRDEEEKALEEVQKMVPFKLAKLAAAAEASSAADPEGDALMFFPGADQAEVAQLIGLDAEAADSIDTGGYEPGRGGGASLYDHWSKSAQPKVVKPDASMSSSCVHEQYHLHEEHILDLCDLSLEAFAPAPASEGEDLQASALRMEALDASLELFVRQCVSSASHGKLASRAVLLPDDAAARLLPLAILRLQHGIRQLRLERSMLSEEGAVKRSACSTGRARLHSGAACAFYAESNPAILLQLAVPLNALLMRTRELLMVYEAHPSLLAIEGLIEKIRQLRILQTTPMAVVTMLELLLGRVEVWEEAASRQVSLKLQLRPLESLLVSLRERQLLEWRELRQLRERHSERQGAKGWLHLIAALAKIQDPRELVDELLRFVRTSPVGEFKVRLKMLRAAAHLHLEAQGEGSQAGRVALHVFCYIRKWLPVIEKALAQGRESMEKEVQDLVKIVRWDLSNYNALKESVSRSHKQLSKVIRRFDDSLQMLVDTALTTGLSTSDQLARPTVCAGTILLAAAAFVLPEGAAQSLVGTDATQQAERMVDDEAFWGNPCRVAAVLPVALGRFIQTVSKHLLPDTFCFGAPEGGSLRSAEEDLCSAAAEVLKALQDEELATAMKRRRLQGLRELCGLYGFAPRPVAADALDVMDFFSGSVMPSAEEADDAASRAPTRSSAPKPEGERVLPHAVHAAKEDESEEPPLKRIRSEKSASQGAPGGECDVAFGSYTAAAWRRMESLKYDLIHLVLRLHSVRARPSNLSGGDVSLWLGIAVGCIHAVRWHRERCISFHRVLAGFSAQCGAAMTGQSVAVKRCHLALLFGCLDRLFEGCSQAQLVASSLTGPEETKLEVKSLDGATAQVGSILRFVFESDEYQAYFGQDCPPGLMATGACLRVRRSFLQDLLQLVREAMSHLNLSLDGFSGCLPESLTAGLRAIMGELCTMLDSLKANVCWQEVAPSSQVSLKILRDLLLAMQQARRLWSSDPSLAISAASPTAGTEDPAGNTGTSADATVADKGAEDTMITEGSMNPAAAKSAGSTMVDAAGAVKEEHAKAENTEAEVPLPQLGLGRALRPRALFEVLQLDHLRSRLCLYVNELPPGPAESPLTPFTQQTVLLARALLTCGLEAGLAATEASVSLLRLICFLFEQGLGTKSQEQEDDDKDDGRGQKQEWQSGTGMGDGEGLKDVTDEIEDDGQLEGTKDEKEENKPNPEVPKDQEDEAREVGFDLDTEAQAVPQDEKPDSEQPEKQDDSNLDRQKDDVDLNAGGTLDEKMWNGEEDESNKEREEGKEKEKEQKEEIEAHGAKAEGEAETTAKEEAEEQGGGKEKEKPGDNKNDSKDEKDVKDKSEDPHMDQDEEPGQQEKTKWDEEDAQFDVNMQKEGPGAQDAEGDANSNCDLESEFVNDEGLEEGSDCECSGASGDEKEDGEGDPEMDGVVDLDSVNPTIPNQPEDEEPGPLDKAADACTQGEAGQPKEQPPPEEECQDTASAKDSKGQDKPETSQPPTQGDPVATSAGHDTGVPQPETMEDKVFDGSAGASTSLETSALENQGSGEASSSQQDGGVTTTPEAGKSSSEVPTAQPEQANMSGQRQLAAPPEGTGAEADQEERCLQKVDILRGANEGEQVGGEEQQTGAERGLHLADPKNGVDALGECQDVGNAPDKAMGMSEQQGDETNTEAAAAIEEDEQHGGEKDQSLASLRLQEMERDTNLDGLKALPDEDANEEQLEAMQVDGMAGSANLSNVVRTELALLHGAEPEELPAAAQAAQAELELARRQRPESELRQLWGQLERCTAPLATALCEQLRIILEPTLKGRLQGFYRTGKRISMRRVIPFIASNYRRDKIWLRRTKPSKREYQVIVAIDNSRSMHECGVGPIALQTLSVICQALSQLEVGEYAVLAFGSAAPRVLLPLGQGQPHTAVFGWEQAQTLLSEFTFDEESVDSHNRSFADMMRLGSSMFDERSNLGPQHFNQMMLIISDGRFNKAKVRSWVHAALAQRQLPLLIIVDSAEEPSRSARRSVFDIKAVSYEGGHCNVVPYLQDFPFPYYVIVQDLQALPGILSDVLKQWFELTTAV